MFVFCPEGSEEFKTSWAAKIADAGASYVDCVCACVDSMCVCVWIVCVWIVCVRVCVCVWRGRVLMSVCVSVCVCG